MLKLCPYEKCPIYESRSFIFRLVEESDASELLKCYSDAAAVKLMNSDTCTSDFHYATLEEMLDCIHLWLAEYDKGGFVRFSVVERETDKPVGTIEIFGGEYGVLRIDLLSEYEKQKYILEIIDLSVKSFYDEFNINKITTKAIPEAAERLTVLKQFGFEKDNNFRPGLSYYSRERRL